jgi:conjugative relaxase-like TrwC/TraI family protein
MLYLFVAQKDFNPEYLNKDYLSGRQASYWLGKGSVADLYEELDNEKRYSRLVNWKRLGKGNGKPTALTHITLSPPKSVSVAGLVYGFNDAIKAHEDAVLSCIMFLEKELYYRIANDGIIEFKRVRSYIAYLKHQYLSRANDPNLHSNISIFNITQDRNNTYKALYIKKLFDKQKTLGLIYRQYLAQNLTKAGFSLKWDEYGCFDIKAIPKNVSELFSQRKEESRKAVKEVMACDFNDLPYKVKKQFVRHSRIGLKSVTETEIKNIWEEDVLSISSFTSKDMNLEPQPNEVSKTNVKKLVLIAFNDLINNSNRRIKRQHLVYEAAALKPSQFLIDKIERAIDKLIVEKIIIRISDKYLSNKNVEYVCWKTEQKRQEEENHNTLLNTELKLIQKKHYRQCFNNALAQSNSNKYELDDVVVFQADNKVRKFKKGIDYNVVGIRNECIDLIDSEGNIIVLNIEHNIQNKWRVYRIIHGPMEDKSYNIDANSVIKFRVSRDNHRQISEFISEAGLSNARQYFELKFKNLDLDKLTLSKSYGPKNRDIRFRVDSEDKIKLSKLCEMTGLGITDFCRSLFLNT